MVTVMHLCVWMIFTCQCHGRCHAVVCMNDIYMLMSCICVLCVWVIFTCQCHGRCMLCMSVIFTRQCHGHCHPFVCLSDIYISVSWSLPCICVMWVWVIFTGHCHDHCHAVACYIMWVSDVCMSVSWSLSVLCMCGVHLSVSWSASCLCTACMCAVNLSMSWSQLVGLLRACIMCRVCIYVSAMIIENGLLPSILLRNVQIVIPEVWALIIKFVSISVTKFKWPMFHEQYRLLNWPQTLTDYRKWGQFNKHT